jgi:S1-C subfamily serine protease
VTTLDWIAVGFVALTALAGLRRGLIGTALSLAGLVGGAVIGDRVGPRLLTSGSHSPYLPLAALLGAVVGAVALRAAASILASFLRNGLRLVPPLHALDSIGGLAAGALFGLVVVWVIGAVALELPGEPTFRRLVQQSRVLSELNTIAPPNELLRALARYDDLPSLAAPVSAPGPPDAGVVDEPGVRAAEPSVVRITDEACGLGVEGSGWVAHPGLVVTAAHVVAGASGIHVDGMPARVYAIDRTNDVAVLDVPGLTAPPLRYEAARDGVGAAILGFPENGGYTVRPGRLGPTITARFNGGSPRRVTELSGLVQPGNSGGPVIDASGVVQTTVFAAGVGSRVGYGVPTEAVASALADARHPIPDGRCWSE